MIKTHHYSFLFIFLFIVPGLLSQDDIENALLSANRQMKKGNFDSCMIIIDRVAKIEKRNGYPIASNTAKVDAFIRFEEYKKAYSLSKEIETNFCELNTDLNCQECSGLYLIMASWMANSQRLKESMDYLNKICPDDVMIWNPFYEKAKVLLEQKDTSNAVDIMHEGLLKQRVQGDTARIIAALNAYGIIQSKAQLLRGAIKTYQEVITLINESGKAKQLEPVVLGNIGSAFYSLGDFDLAYSNLVKDAEFSIQYDQVGSHINASILLAQIDFERGNYDQAIQRLTTLYEIFLEQMNPSQKMELLTILTRSLKADNRIEAYLIYYDALIELTLERINIQSRTNEDLSAIISTFSYEKVVNEMESEKQLLDSELRLEREKRKREKFQNWTVLVGIVSALVIVILLFFRYRSNQRKETKLKDLRIKDAEREQEVLKLRLEHELKHLNMLTVELDLKQEFSKNLLGVLSSHKGLSSPELKSLELFVQNELDFKTTRSEIQKSMGDVGASFTNKLEQAYPYLTKSDLKLAAMVVLNMSNKEIGLSKNITEASVKKAKTRLKRKMNLTQEHNFRDYLKRLINKS